MKLKKIGFLILLLPLLLSFEARGDGYSYNYDSCCPQYCDSCNFCEDWVIYGEWLYWRTRRCDLDYAVTGSSSTTFRGRVHDVELCYDHGFRVGVQKYCNCLFFDIFYTYFRNNETSSVTNTGAGGLSGTRVVDDLSGVSQGSIIFARGKWDLDYDVVDILAGYEWCSMGCLQTYFFGGLKLAYIDQKLESFYRQAVSTTTPAAKVTEKIDMDAYGVDLGIGANYDIWRCLSFFGRFSYDVLLGDFKRKFLYQSSTNGGATYSTQADFHDDCWRMLSVFNLSFGLEYGYLFSNCWCTDLSIAIGYEFHNWVGQPDFLDFQSESGETTFDRHLQSLGFDGLFVRLSVGF